MYTCTSAAARGGGGHGAANASWSPTAPALGIPLRVRHTAYDMWWTSTAWSRTTPPGGVPLYLKYMNGAVIVRVGTDIEYEDKVVDLAEEVREPKEHRHLPNELCTAEQWERRSAHRQAGHDAVKRTSDYVRWCTRDEMCGTRLRPPSPDPCDKRLSKRMWERSVQTWRVELRKEYPSHA